MANIKKTAQITVKTITPAVYLTGDYNANPQAKAKELTKLIDGLLVTGIWTSALEAAMNNIPAETFIIVDDPDTPELEFSVQIVPSIFQGKNVIDEGPSKAQA